MALLRNNKTVYKTIIVSYISLVLLLLPIAQSLACSSTYAVDLSTSEEVVHIQVQEMVSLISTTVQKQPSCHSAEKISDPGYNNQLSASVSVCDGDCCNYCMNTYITNTSSFIDTHYDSFFRQVTIFQLKPDFLSIPVLPPPIV